MGTILKGGRSANSLLFETSIISCLSDLVNLFFGSGLSTRGRWSSLTVLPLDHRW
ncbi:hypothetical protein [Halanaerobium praevalens]|uniref:hypothetical protein n=1 Tax=Halanaerobium praevalens TaxID=2331 RepID=UPI00145CEC27|nr:hypothetical protein [Halanaerobium praevalens]